MISSVKKIATLLEDEKHIPRAVTFSKNGNYLAVRSTDNRIAIWDWKRQRIQAWLKLPRGANDSLATTPMDFSPTSDIIAACHTASDQGEVVTIWDAQTGSVVKQIIDKSVGAGCTAIAFSPDGRSLIRSSTRLQSKPGDTLISYKVADWTVEWAIRTAPLRTVLLALSPDGKSIAMGGVQSIAGPNSVDLHPLLKSEGTGGDSLIAVFARDTSQLINVTKISSKIDSFSRMAWQPDNKSLTIFAGSDRRTIDAFSGVLLREIQGKAEYAIVSLDYANTNAYMVLARSGKDGFTQILDVAGEKLLYSLGESSGAVAITPDGKHIATASMGMTSIWQVN